MDQRSALLVLGLPSDASPAEVEEAYARRVREVQRVAAQAPTLELRASCLQTLEELERARQVASDPRYRPTGRTARPEPVQPQWSPGSARFPVAAAEEEEGNTTDTMAESDTSDLEGTDSFRLAVDVAGYREDFQLRLGTFRIGRAPENELTVDDTFFSRFHCEIVVEAGRATLFDLESTNGTLVNRRQVKQRRLRAGDRISIGSMEAVFRPGERVGLDRLGWWVPILACALVGGLLLGFGLRAQRHAPGSWWRLAAGLHALWGQPPAARPPSPRQPQPDQPRQPQPTAFSGPARITLESPGQEAWVNRRSIWLRGQVQPREGLELTLADRFIAMDERGVFAAEVNLPDDVNQLRLVAITREGEPKAELELVLHVDMVPPELRLVQPSVALSNQAAQEVRVWASDEAIRVAVSGQPLQARGQGIHTGRIELEEGAQLLIIEAWDRAGNRAQVEHPLRIDTTPPGCNEVQMRLAGDSVRVELQCDEALGGYQTPGGPWRAHNGDRLACLVSFASADTLELGIRDAAGNAAAVALHHEHLAEAYLRRARTQAGAPAIADLELCLRLHPARLDVELELDRLLFEAGRVEEGFARLASALLRWPEAPALWELRARQRRSAGRAQEALQDLQVLQRLEPDRAGHWALAGSVWLELADPVAARQQWEEAVRLGFDEAWLWEGLADLRERAGALAEALAALYALRSLRGDDAALCLRCARLENQLGREVDALTLLDLALQFDATLLPAYVLRSAIRIRHNRLDGALADCDQAIALDARCVEAWSQRSQVYSLQGQLAKALHDAGEVIALAPSADAFNARAAVALALRRYAEAEADCLAALELDPQHGLAIHNLERARRGLRGE